MPAHTRETGSVHRIRMPGAIRCYWSDVAVSNDSKVRMHVETELVADGAAVDVISYLADPETNRRVRRLEAASGAIAGNAMAREYHVLLKDEDFDAARDAAVLIFEATIPNYRLRAESQRLHVGRPRFSI